MHKLTTKRTLVYSLSALCILAWVAAAAVFWMTHEAKKPANQGSEVLSSQSKPLQSSLVNAPTLIPTEVPTVVPVVLKNTSPIEALVDCLSYGVVIKLTKANCDQTQATQKASQERWDKILAESSKRVEYKIEPPPTLTPLNPQPTAISCNYSAKSTYDAQYQSESNKLYSQYQSAMAKINASGAGSSSAPVAAYGAYQNGQNNLDNQYQANLASINC